MKKRKQSNASQGVDVDPTKRPLTARQAAFVQEYLIDLNQTKAAIRAGYSPKAAQEQSSRLMTFPHVKAAIDQAKAARAERTQLDQDRVLTHWAELAQADARELVEYRRCACRFCHGVGFAYQWRTQREFDAAVQEAVAKEMVPPTDQGGYGFTRNKAPNPDCPECDGLGEGQMIMKDTRTLAPGAARLYAGTQIGKDGLKVLMEDRSAALVNVAKHLGMLDPKLTLKGDKDNPLRMLLDQMQGSSLKPTSDPDGDDD